MPLENVQGGDMLGDTAHISTPVCRRGEGCRIWSRNWKKNMVRIFRPNLSSLSAEVQVGKTSGAAALRGGVGDGRVEGIRAPEITTPPYPQHNDEERLTIFAAPDLRHCLQPGNTLNASPTCSRCRKPESIVIRANVRHTHGCKSTNRRAGRAGGIFGPDCRAGLRRTERSAGAVPCRRRCCGLSVWAVKSGALV